MARRKPVQIGLSFDGRQWVGRGGRVSVQGPTLRAAKQRVRMEVEKFYGDDAEFSIALELPAMLQSRVDAYRQKRAEYERLSVEQRDSTISLVEILRIQLGFGNTDSAEMLKIDPSTLTRLMSTVARFKPE